MMGGRLRAKREALRAAGYSEAEADRPLAGIFVDGGRAAGRVPVVRNVERGVVEAGGLTVLLDSGPDGLPQPSMAARNLTALRIESALAHGGLDAAVFIVSDDLAAAACLLAAISADVPAIFLPWKDPRRRAPAFMPALIEALGLALPAHRGEAAAARATGEWAVRLAQERRTPAAVLTRAALFNGLRVLLALGAPPDAFVHLIAAGRRFGETIAFEDVATAAAGARILTAAPPWRADGGLAPGNAAALMRAIGPEVNRLAATITGETWESVFTGLEHRGDAAARPAANRDPLAVLRGTLAPEGALINAASGAPARQRHRGRAVVFDGIDDMLHRIHDPARRIDKHDVLVLRGVGPVGAGSPSMAIPIPNYLAEQGVADMVRVTDGGLGEAVAGTIAAHVGPEAAVGGPLDLVRDGDLIELDVAKGRLELLVVPEELERRRRMETVRSGLWRGQETGHSESEHEEVCGTTWERLHGRVVRPAHEGADLGEELVPVAERDVPDEYAPPAFAGMPPFTPLHRRRRRRRPLL